MASTRRGIAADQVGVEHRRRRLLHASDLRSALLSYPMRDTKRERVATQDGKELAYR